MPITKNNNLLIIGAGQYGLVALEIAQAMDRFDKIAFLDDSYKVPEKVGEPVEPAEAPHIIGTTRDIEKFAGEYHYGFVTISNPQIRRRLIEQLRYNCITPAILVHPRAYVGPNAQLQMGCCVEPLATVQSGAVVATASFVASGAIVKYNAFVGEFCRVDSNAVVESNAIVPAETNIGCNSVFCKEQGVCLADNNVGRGV